jgi:hypothetical protein
MTPCVVAVPTQHMHACLVPCFCFGVLHVPPLEAVHYMTPTQWFTARVGNTIVHSASTYNRVLARHTLSGSVHDSCYHNAFYYYIQQDSTSVHISVHQHSTMVHYSTLHLPTLKGTGGGSFHCSAALQQLPF